MSLFADNAHLLAGTDWWDADAGSNNRLVRSRLRALARRLTEVEVVKCPKCGGGTWTRYHFGTWNPKTHHCWEEKCGGVVEVKA